MPPAPIFHLLTIRFHLFGICWNNWTNTPGRLPLESKVGGRGILHGHLVALMMSHANYFSNSQITSIAVASFGRVLPVLEPVGPGSDVVIDFVGPTNRSPGRPQGYCRRLFQEILAFQSRL